MAEKQMLLEEQVEELRTEVLRLGHRLDSLERRIGEGLESPPPAENKVSEGGRAADASEQVLGWVGRASLLPRIAAVCFLLVIALILRTLTDNEIVSRDIGSLVGMAYAAGLIAWGWRGYRTESSLAPVFTVCGAFLVFSVVVETHEHFGSLSTVPAYLIVAAAGAVLAAISHLYRVALPVFVGTLGMCFAGVALDFPHPVFPYLFVLLLVANGLGAFATRLQRCSWLRWILFAVTVFMMQVWAFRLGIMLSQGDPADLPFQVAGFFPSVSVLFLAYMGIALAGIRGRITERVSKFDYALPTFNALWAFLVARYVVNSGMGSEMKLGLCGIVAGALHLGFAFWIGRRDSENHPGVNSFVLGGTLLMMMGLSVATTSGPPVLALLSGLALGLAVWSGRWRNGAMRLTSYGLQVYACLALAALLRETEGISPSGIGAVSSGALAVIAFSHFLWSRKNPPPSRSAVFERFDRKDRSAVLLLLAALAGGYFAARMGLYQWLKWMVEGPAFGDLFSVAQTVLINGAATVLMCYALARRDREVRNVAILVTVIGGIKVFLFDLLGIEGVPVVVSVLSFGVAAAIESFALTRWQRIDHLRVSPWRAEETEDFPGRRSRDMEKG